jgi:hypothetical protein
MAQGQKSRNTGEIEKRSIRLTTKRKAEALTASAERGEVPSPIDREQEAPPDTRESEAEKREKKGTTYSQAQRVFDPL